MTTNFPPQYRALFPSACASSRRGNISSGSSRMENGTGYSAAKDRFQQEWRFLCHQERSGNKRNAPASKIKGK